MLNQLKKVLLTGFTVFSLTLTALVPSCLPVFAEENDTYLTTINVREGLRLKLNGQSVQPVDAAGESVPVFLYGSTTYVPVRFISQYYGMEVDWVPESATVQIWNNGEGNQVSSPASTDTETFLTDIYVRMGLSLELDGRSVIPTDVYGLKVPVFLYGSTTYVPVRFISEFYDMQVNWIPETATVEILSQAPETSETKEKLLEALQDRHWVVSNASDLASTNLFSIEFGEAEAAYATAGNETGTTTYYINKAAVEESADGSHEIMNGQITFSVIGINGSLFENVKASISYDDYYDSDSMNLVFKDAKLGDLLTPDGKGITFLSAKKETDE